MFAELQKKDEIYEKLNNIFEEKIGAEFEKDKLEKIYQEGAIRYQKKIPPGFEDEKNKNGVNKFGDLIMWEQIKIKAKESQRNLILVTDERKKDWWWKLRDGKVIGPRYELVNEIWGFAEIDFLMYSSDRFLSYSYRYLNEQVDENVIEEIKDRKWVESDIAEYKRLVWLSDFFTEYNKTKDQSEIINYEEFNTGLQGEHRSFLSDRYILNIKELDEKLKYLEGKDDEKNNKERFLLEEKRIKMIEEFYDFLNIE